MTEVYLDMTRGIAGDMFVSASYAYMDGPAKDEFRSRAMPMADELGLRSKMEELRNGNLIGCRISWESEETIGPRSAMEAEKMVRRCCDILDLSDRSTQYSLKVLQDVVNAEARAHDIDAGQVHLHEIGRPTGLANIALAALCIELLDLLETPLTGSYISIGQGRVGTAHGSLSIPTPAASYLLEGMRFRFGPFEGRWQHRRA